MHSLGGKWGHRKRKEGEWGSGADLGSRMWGRSKTQVRESRMQRVLRANIVGLVRRLANRGKAREKESVSIRDQQRIRPKQSTMERGAWPATGFRKRCEHMKETDRHGAWETRRAMPEIIIIPPIAQANTGEQARNGDQQHQDVRRGGGQGHHGDGD